MKEFWLWVAVVTLILFMLFLTTMGLVYNNKQIKKAEAILQRAEQLEKKSAKPRNDPKPDNDADGL